MAAQTKIQELEVRTKVDGIIYSGTATVRGEGDGAMVRVTYGGLSDAAPAGETGPETIARVLLGELVTKSLQKA